MHAHTHTRTHKQYTPVSSLSLVTARIAKNHPGPASTLHQQATTRPGLALKSDAAGRFSSPGPPLGKQALPGAGLDQSCHKPELKPRLAALLNQLIIFHGPSLTGALLLFPSPPAFEWGPGGSRVDWIFFLSSPFCSLVISMFWKALYSITNTLITVFAALNVVLKTLLPSNHVHRGERVALGASCVQSSLWPA